MPIKIEMPRLSDTMEEGTLVSWNVAVGDKVEAGAALADVETDKATMSLDAFEDGTVAKLCLDEGDTVPVGTIILVLAEPGEDVEEAAKVDVSSGGDSGGGGEATSSDEDKADEDKAEEKQDAPAESEPAPAAEAEVKTSQGEGPAPGRIRVSPVARNMAEEHGLDLAQIEGTGPEGRIIKRDVQKAIEGGAAQAASKAPAAAEKAPSPAASAPAPAPIPGTDIESRSIKLTGMRKTIAKRLSESKTTIPEFQVTVSCDMQPLMKLRSTLNAQLESQGVKLSVNDFIVRATALSLIQHPVLNASWGGETVDIHGSVNIGVAVALPEEKGGGLVVPVIKQAHQKGLRSISLETKKLAKKARESGLTPDEMGEGTFTISNLGMYGVDHFTAIINPPQVGILAVGAAIAKPVVRDGEIVPGLEMSATLTADHRVADGAVAAEYLNTFKQMIENPAVLLV